MNIVFAKDEELLLADPKIFAISVHENHEQMVDLKHESGILYGPSPEIENNTDYTKLRKIVYEKLIEAQKKLPSGLRFCLYEGYRSLQLQEKLFTTRFDFVRALHPTWSREEIFIETTRMVSPVVNLDGTKNIPPHSTGGAFDIYLVDMQGDAVDMGIHPKDWMQDSDGSISKTISSKISKTAKHYRAIMSEVLSSVGFVNYTAEYWHWSYGDRYWAYFTKHDATLYGSI